MVSSPCAVQVDDGPIIGGLGSTSQPPALSLSFENLGSNPTLTLRIECSTKVPKSEEWSEFSWSVYDICEATWIMDKLQIYQVSEGGGSPKIRHPALVGLMRSWDSHLVCISFDHTPRNQRYNLRLILPLFTSDDVRRSLENLYYASGDRYQIRVWFVVTEGEEISSRLKIFTNAVMTRRTKLRRFGFSSTGSPLID